MSKNSNRKNSVGNLLINNQQDRPSLIKNFSDKVFYLLSVFTAFQIIEFGNGSIISDESLVILEFKYLPNKKMIETRCKKCQNKEDLQNILTIFISLR